MAAAVTNEVYMVFIEDVKVYLVPKLGGKAQEGRVALVRSGAIAICQFEVDTSLSLSLTCCCDPFSPNELELAQ